MKSFVRFIFFLASLLRYTGSLPASHLHARHVLAVGEVLRAGQCGDGRQGRGAVPVAQLTLFVPIPLARLCADFLPVSRFKRARMNVSSVTGTFFAAVFCVWSGGLEYLAAYCANFIVRHACVSPPIAMHLLRPVLHQQCLSIAQMRTVRTRLQFLRRIASAGCPAGRRGRSACPSQCVLSFSSVAGNMALAYSHAARYCVSYTVPPCTDLTRVINSAMSENQQPARTKNLPVSSA